MATHEQQILALHRHTNALEIFSNDFFLAPNRTLYTPRIRQSSHPRHPNRGHRFFSRECSTLEAAAVACHFERYLFSLALVASFPIEVLSAAALHDENSDEP